MEKFGFNEKEIEIFKSLDSPKKIQDFLDKIPINFEKSGETCLSPRMVLKKRRCHCIEAALFAATALRFHGKKPLVVDMKTTNDDLEHVITVFQENGKWGAISKTNHSVLRYREPVYRDIRELVMSYFHEYFNKKGKKTLRSFSMPIDLSIFDKKKWTISKENLWYIHDYLDKVKHIKILGKEQARNLRKVDKLERKASNLTEWKR